MSSKENNKNAGNINATKEYQELQKNSWEEIPNYREEHTMPQEEIWFTSLQKQQKPSQIVLDKSRIWLTITLSGQKTRQRKQVPMMWNPRKNK